MKIPGLDSRLAWLYSHVHSDALEYLPLPMYFHNGIGGGMSYKVTFLPPHHLLKWTHKDTPHDAEQERKIPELLVPHSRIIR